jgi:hypothetical protein
MQEYAALRTSVDGLILVPSRTWRQTGMAVNGPEQKTARNRVPNQYRSSDQALGKFADAGVAGQFSQGWVVGQFEFSGSGAR